MGVFQQWQEIRRLRKARIEQAHRVQTGGRPIHDPIEDDPRFRDILQAADTEAEQELAHVAKGMGFCHRLWRVKQTILMRKYGVVWFSPSDLNGARFD